MMKHLCIATLASISLHTTAMQRQYPTATECWRHVDATEQQIKNDIATLKNQLIAVQLQTITEPQSSLREDEAVINRQLSQLLIQLNTAQLLKTSFFVQQNS